MKKVHFIGIGGIGMSALAQHYANCGFLVTGSDRQKNEQTEKLEGLGIKVFCGHNGQNVDDVCFVVTSHAIDQTNCEVVEAKQKGIPIFSRDFLLGNVFSHFSTRIAVAGAHGKTTTCAMLLFALNNCGIYPTAFIGGEIKGKGNYIKGSDDVIIVEACEYKRSFLNLFPTHAIILNIDLDHPDCYPCQSQLLWAFSSFANNVEKDGILVFNGDILPSALFLKALNGACCFGRSKHNKYTTSCVTSHRGGFGCLCHLFGKRLCPLKNVIPPHTNIDNALATIALCNELGLDINKAAQGIENFCGTKRRFEQVSVGDTTLYIDYAHHPTQIASLIDYSVTLGKKVVAFFQPHTFSRTAALMDSFACCFDKVDKLYLLPTYAAREKEIDGACHFHLHSRISQRRCVDCQTLETFSQAAEIIKKDCVDCTVLLIGAGDIDQIVKLL